MEIQPNSTIKLIRNIPLCNNYKDTIYFNNSTEQYTYFNQKSFYTFNNQSYQRHSKNQLKIQVLADNIINCNYLMFKNTSYGDKWFYAFVLDVEYINNITSLVTYEIDVMQTYHFDYNFKPCLVEREHVADDSLFKHIKQENIATGPFTQTLKFEHIYTSYKIVFACTFDGEYNDFYGGFYGGYYSGLFLHYFDSASEAMTFLDGASENMKDEGIVCCYMLPAAFVCGPDTPLVTSYTNYISKSGLTNWTYNYNGKSGPRNNKLYCSPFNSLIVSNNNGNTTEYLIELFANQETITFMEYGTPTPNSEVILIPNYYAGKDLSVDTACVINDFPQCSWAGDAYRAWLAQNSTRVKSDALFNILGSTLGAITSGVNGNLSGVASGFLNTIQTANNVSIDYDLALKSPDRARGNSSSNINMALKKIGFSFYNQHITPEYAAFIDDYFDRWGYYVNIIKTPSRNNRESYTYVKTNGCITSGNLPAECISKINNIMDSGITFWKSSADVGNYNSSNNTL